MRIRADDLHTVQWKHLPITTGLGPNWRNMAFISWKPTTVSECHVFPRGLQ